MGESLVVIVYRRVGGWEKARYLLGLDFDGVGVEGFEVVLSGVLGVVASATHPPTDQTDPQVSGAGTFAADGGVGGEGVVVVPTHWA